MRKIIAMRRFSHNRNRLCRQNELLESRLLLTGVDFNTDGRIDGLDADLLTNEIASGSEDLNFDLSSDGQVGAADLQTFLELIQKPLGDADFSGKVGFEDFLILSGNFGNPGAYTQGDFNADGQIGFPDFLLLSGNFGSLVETDIVSPEISLQAQDATKLDSPSIDVFFTEVVQGPVLQPDTFVIRNESGQPVVNVVSGVDQLRDSSYRLQLSSPLSDDAAYQLIVNSEVTDVAGNPVPESTSFNVWERFRIFETSPGQGEEMVAPTRELIVRLTGEVDPNTVSNESLRVVANSQQLEGRINVSSTNRFFTFYPTQPWPESTQIRVEVDGNLIRSSDGSQLDADLDAKSGGVGVFEFRTLPLTRIPGTNVEGVVRDSYTGEPLPGVTIRVDGFPTLDVNTDAQGKFLLLDTPSPEFFVHIDGTTANAPVGFSYPNVGKKFYSIPGETIQLNHDGEPFDVFLPPQSDADSVALNLDEADDPVDVGFGEGGLAELSNILPDVDAAEWEKLQVTIPPGSAQDDFGNPATTANIIPVPPDRLPGPLPPGANPDLVISIQAPGATTFDVPAPITFPNLQDRPLGEKAEIFSFDHDKGEWKPIGLATVVEDGKGGSLVKSDAGVGILAPGWHYTDDGPNWTHGGGGCTGDCRSQMTMPPNARFVLPDSNHQITLNFTGPAAPGPRDEHTPPEDRYLSFLIEPNKAFSDIFEISRDSKLSGTLRDGERAKFKAELRSLEDLKRRLNSGGPFHHDAHIRRETEDH